MIPNLKVVFLSFQSMSYTLPGNIQEALIYVIIDAIFQMKKLRIKRNNLLKLIQLGKNYKFLHCFFLSLSSLH